MSTSRCTAAGAFLPTHRVWLQLSSHPFSGVEAGDRRFAVPRCWREWDSNCRSAFKEEGGENSKAHRLFESLLLHQRVSANWRDDEIRRSCRSGALACGTNSAKMRELFRSNPLQKVIDAHSVINSFGRGYNANEVAGFEPEIAALLIRRGVEYAWKRATMPQSSYVAALGMRA
jgi:hypothetical protein